MLKGNFASIKLDFENMESITIPKTAIKSIDFRVIGMELSLNMMPNIVKFN